MPVEFQTFQKIVNVTLEVPIFPSRWIFLNQFLILKNRFEMSLWTLVPRFFSGQPGYLLFVTRLFWDTLYISIIYIFLQYGTGDNKISCLYNCAYIRSLFNYGSRSICFGTSCRRCNSQSLKYPRFIGNIKFNFPTHL